MIAYYGLWPYNAQPYVIYDNCNYASLDTFIPQKVVFMFYCIIASYGNSILFPNNRRELQSSEKLISGK